MKKNKNEKIDLLIVIPCDYDSLNSLDSVTNYPEMKCYFFLEALKSLNLDKNIRIISMPTAWTEKSKNKFFEFKYLLKLKNIDLTNVRHVLFAGLGALKQWRPSKKRTVQNSLDLLEKNVNGNIFKWEDTNIRGYSNTKIYTIGHFTNSSSSTENYFEAGLCVAKLFKPQQDWDSKTLKIHIDHDLPGRHNSFKIIKQIIATIQDRIDTHPYWEDLEIFYHDKPCKIEDIGHDKYGKIKITELSEIYGKTHISFMSHKETLGQYPLEMLSSGATVITSPKYFPFDHKKFFDIIDINKEVNYDNLLDKVWLQENSIKNLEKIKELTFEKFAEKVINFIFKT